MTSHRPKRQSHTDINYLNQYKGLTTLLLRPKIIPGIETRGAYITSKKHFTSEEAQSIGETLDTNWGKFDVEQYRMGLDIKPEHGLVDLHTNVTNDDPTITGKIA